MSIKKILKATVITGVALLTLSSAINLPNNNVNARHIRTHRVRHHISRAKIRRIRARNSRHRRKATRKCRNHKIHRISNRNRRIRARKARYRNKARRQHKSIVRPQKHQFMSLMAKPTTDQSQTIKTQLAKDLFNTRKKMYDQEEITDDGIYENKKLDKAALTRANELADQKYSTYDNNNQQYANSLVPITAWCENYDTTYQNNPGTNNPKQIAEFFNNQFINNSGKAESGNSYNGDDGTNDNMKHINVDTGIGVTYRPGRGYYAEELFVQ